MIELRTARAWAVPLSVLRGQAAPGGVWTTHDSLTAQALILHEETLCSGCGQPMTESMDPDTEGEWVTPPPMRCHACTSMHTVIAAYGKADAPEALRFGAERRPARAMHIAQ